MSIISYTELIILLLSVLFSILLPSSSEVFTTDGLFGIAILEAQIRSFIVLPACTASAVGLFFIAAYSNKHRNNSVIIKFRKILTYSALAMMAIGMYYTGNFVLFQIKPPLSFEAGIYIMNNLWIIHTWFSFANVILILSIITNTK